MRGKRYPYIVSGFGWKRAIILLQRLSGGDIKSMSDERNAIQASYDRVATQYAEAFFDELSHKPFDRQLLDRFAECVRGQGAVWDLGCGPGHVGRYVHELGIPVSGLDLSQAMVECAQRLNPEMTFIQGTMLNLPAPDASLAGIVSFYAIIHLTRAAAALALREFHRALQSGGYLLIAFHGGKGEIHSDEWYGERVDITATLFTAEEMARAARATGFVVVEMLERPPYTFEYQTPRIYLLARKPA